MSFEFGGNEVPSGYRELLKGEVVLSTDQIPAYAGGWKFRHPMNNNIGRSYDPNCMDTTIRAKTGATLCEIFGKEPREYPEYPVDKSAEVCKCQSAEPKQQSVGKPAPTPSEVDEVEIPAGFRELNDGEKFEPMDLSWYVADNVPSYWRTFSVDQSLAEFSARYNHHIHQVTIRAIGNPIPTFEADLLSIDNALDACRELISVVVGNARRRANPQTN